VASALAVTPTTIGSDAEADVRVRRVFVSPRHAEVTFYGGSFFVRDLGSRAGTFLVPASAVPGKAPEELAVRVGTQPMRLAEGVAICLGDPQSAAFERLVFHDGSPIRRLPRAAGAAASTWSGELWALAVIAGLGLVLSGQLGFFFRLFVPGLIIAATTHGSGKRAARASAGRAAPPYLRMLATILDAALLVFLIRIDFSSGLPAALGIEVAGVWLFGRTPGKWLCGLVVRDGYGRPVGPFQALARAIGKLFSFATLGLGFLPALFSSRGRALHDLLADTTVQLASPEEGS
jgi:uncharacterized RDD family membrane protein YckC